jgi:hypothetical protein
MTMTDLDIDKVFAGSIPKLYETYLVPLIFEPYAADLAHRLSARPVSRILEVAAGRRTRWRCRSVGGLRRAFRPRRRRRQDSRARRGRPWLTRPACQGADAALTSRNVRGR